MIRSDEYDSWKETRAIQSDRKLMEEIRQGLPDLEKGGRIYTLEELMPED